MRRSSNSNGGRQVVGSRAIVLINGNSNNHHHSTLDTVNAAANHIAFVHNSFSQPTAAQQKRRWGSGCWKWKWNVYWCFGFGNQRRSRKRIGHAVFGPEESQPPAAPPPENHNHNQQAAAAAAAEGVLLHQLTAPPSSPASFLPSEPPSSTQSPAAAAHNNLVMGLSPPGSFYSPVSGRASFFVIGPYANETDQLVSPPALSTITTDPSTSPFTPPPHHSFHLTTTTSTSTTTTTPSSPEVPFAHHLLLHHPSNIGHHRFSSSSSSSHHHDFHYYYYNHHFHPGSPAAGQLLTSPPSPPISGSWTSSPFRDITHFSPPLGFPCFMDSFYVGDPPTPQGSATPTSDSDLVVLDRQSSDLAGGALPNLDGWRQNNQPPNCRFFFDLTPADRFTQPQPEGEMDVPPQQQVPTHRRHRTITLGCANDFNFEDELDGGDHLNQIAPPDDLESHQGSVTLTATTHDDSATLASTNINNDLDRKSCDLGGLMYLDSGHQVGNRRLFFELTADNHLTQPETEMKSTLSGPTSEKKPSDEPEQVETPTHCRRRTITFGCVDDFNFQDENGEERGDLAAPRDTIQDSATPAGTSTNFVLDLQPCSHPVELPHLDLHCGLRNNQVAANHGEYFEAAAGDPLRCGLSSCGKTVVEPKENEKNPEREDCLHGNEKRVEESSQEDVDEDGPSHRRHRTITFGCAKDFDFDDMQEEEDNKTGWDGSMVDKEEEDTLENWSFFPIIQPATVS